MATIEQIEALFSRKEKEQKEERKKEREEDKLEIKEAFKGKIDEVAEDVKKIKAKQSGIEGQVEQCKKDVNMKYDNLASKFGLLEKKINEIEQNKNAGQAATTIQTSELFSRASASSNMSHRLQSGFAGCPVQTDFMIGHPSRISTTKVHQASSNFVLEHREDNVGDSENKQIIEEIKVAKTILGFSPISEEDTKHTDRMEGSVWQSKSSVWRRCQCQKMSLMS